MKTRSLMSEDFVFTPFKRVVIGDPLYIEEYPVGSKDYNRLVADYTNPNENRLGFARISKMEYEDEGFVWSCYEVDIIAAPNKTVAKTYLENKYFARSKVSEIELGCDTAGFDFATEDSFIHFDTGADGFYGTLTAYELDGNPLGVHINLSLDCDMYDYERLKNMINAVLKDLEKRG